MSGKNRGWQKSQTETDFQESWIRDGDWDKLSRIMVDAEKSCPFIPTNPIPWDPMLFNV